MHYSCLSADLFNNKLELLTEKIVQYEIISRTTNCTWGTCNHWTCKRSQTAFTEDFTSAFLHH